MDLGTDLKLGRDGDLEGTPSGDIALTSGEANLAQACLRRALRSPGSLMWRPEYGGGVMERLEGENTPATRSLTAQLAQRNLRQEPRLLRSSVVVEEGEGSRQVVISIEGQTPAGPVTTREEVNL